MNFLSNSFYIQKIKKHKNIIIVSLILALLCTFIAYPGVMYTDSYSRIRKANQILEFIFHSKPITASGWLTIGPTILIAICLYLTGNVAFYTLIQAFLFFFATLLLINKLNDKHQILASFIICINPIIFCNSIFHEASVLCVAAIVLYILLLNNAKYSKKKLDNFIEFIVLTFLSFVIVGYRANAITVFPIILFYIFKLKTTKKKKFICTSTLILGYLMIPLITTALHTESSTNYASGFAWEILYTIKNMDTENFLKYQNYLDDIGGEGSTLISIEAVNLNSVNSFLPSKGINSKILANKDNSHKIVKKYIELFFKEPIIFLKNKLIFTSYNLGIKSPLKNLGYEYNLGNKMQDYNFSDTHRRKQFVNIYHKTTDILNFYVSRPWVVFTISIILVLINWLKKVKKRNFYLLILMLSIFYYGAYLLNNQSFELRYFYPSLYLCFILDISIIIDLISKIKIKEIIPQLKQHFHL